MQFNAEIIPDGQLLFGRKVFAHPEGLLSCTRKENLFQEIDFCQGEEFFPEILSPPPFFFVYTISKARLELLMNFHGGLEAGCFVFCSDIQYFYYVLPNPLKIMKNFTVTLALLALLTGSPGLLAQESEPATDYERPYTQMLQGGFSFGYYGYGYVGNRTGITLPLSAAYETFVAEDISAGGFVGYTSFRYEYLDYNYKWTYLDFGIRGSYHYIPLLNELTDAEIDQEKWDFYVTVMLIFERRAYDSNEEFGYNYSNTFNTSLGSVAGFRYKFSPSFAAYFEGGRGTFGYGNLGVTYMF